MSFKAKILNEYSFKTELHLHTNPVSRCASITPSEAIPLYHRLGFHAVTLTNHIDPVALSFAEDDWITHYMNDYNELITASKEYGIAVYLGAEIRFTENKNDYLVYGVDEDVIRNIYRHLDSGIKEFYNSIDKEKTIVLQAHPFRDNMERNYTEHLDGIEVFNMSGHHSRLPQAVTFSQNNPGIKVGGNDLHHPSSTPIIGTRFKRAPKDQFELAQMIKSGDYIFELGDMVVLP